ncbi:MAG TPA: trigger factor [Gemmatimonadales bacterium]|nr:trigger factor [Gemmatimonadales bacterium]
MAEITVTKTAEDQASKALQITVPVDRVRAAEGKALKYYSTRARLPGFRQGKAPEAVVRKRFHDEIRQLVLQEVIREGWDAAKAQEELKPITDPSVRNVKFEDGQPVEFELLVEVKPTITLSRTGGFTVTRTVEPVRDEQVAEQLERIREQKASWLPIEDAQPAPGQMVAGQVAAIEGETVHAGKPFNMVLGSGQAIPELEEQIMTLRPGETRDAEVKFPDDYPDESRRGQTRKVRITLSEVKRQELPPLDDALAREVGDFDTLDALKGAIRTDLEREAERGADAKVREELVHLLAEANNVDTPPSLVDRALHAYMHAYEIPHEQHATFAGQFRPIAVQQVRRDLVLSAVAEQQSLRATEAEIDERIQRIAAARNVSPAEVYKQLQEGQRIAELERSITEEKVFTWLLGQSTVNQG